MYILWYALPKLMPLHQIPYSDLPCTHLIPVTYIYSWLWQCWQISVNWLYCPIMYVSQKFIPINCSIRTNYGKMPHFFPAHGHSFLRPPSCFFAALSCAALSDWLIAWPASNQPMTMRFVSCVCNVTPQGTGRKLGVSSSWCFFNFH